MKTTLIGISMVAVASLGGFGLVACGSDDAASGTTAVRIGATNYVTIPPAASTIPPVTTAPDAAGSVLTAETTYVIQEGDYPSTVATKWKVPFPDLMTLNGWTLDASLNVPEWPGVGQTIRIPAGATVPGVASAGSTATPGTAGSESTTATTSAPDEPDPTTTIASTDTGCNGTYTIEATDTSRQKVAEKFDITVAALDAANAQTNGYSSFYAGLEIVIPKDC